MHDFTAEIVDWLSWCRIFQSVEVWQPLIKTIFRKENLSFSVIEKLTPGTNAVFKVGSWVIKIYAPPESGLNTINTILTETLAMKKAAAAGIHVPQLVTAGSIEDRYRFDYLVMEHVRGIPFVEFAKSFDDDEKKAFGRKLRTTTDLMNKPCDDINGIDLINDQDRYRHWDHYPDRFRRERLDYIKTHDYGSKVLVHGDLCDENLLIDEHGQLFILDFADAVLAPIIYEQALVASALFKFDRAYLSGYFGEYGTDWLLDLCFDGLLIHECGGDVIEQEVAPANEITSLGVMRQRLADRILSTAGPSFTAIPQTMTHND